jgi:hypothetical protein
MPPAILIYTRKLLLDAGMILQIWVWRLPAKSVRVDAVFDIQAGHLTTKDVVRSGLCNIVSAAL